MEMKFVTQNKEVNVFNNKTGQIEHIDMPDITWAYEWMLLRLMWLIADKPLIRVVEKPHRHELKIDKLSDIKSDIDFIEGVGGFTEDKYEGLLPYLRLASMNEQYREVVEHE